MSYLTSLLLVISLLCHPAMAQVGETLNLGDSCSYFGEELPEDVTLFANDEEAARAIQQILSASGLSQNFQVRAAGVPNAAAVLNGAMRLILYNQLFMSQTRERTDNEWAAISIMAHEIAHHLNGDTLQMGGSRPDIELYADYFSGFVLNRMGAKLEDATVAMEMFGSQEASQTHPAKRDRIAAIVSGWKTSQSLHATPSAGDKPPTTPPTKAGELSSTCRFTIGRKAGQVQSYRGQVQPIPLGSPCTDGRGSFGVAVPDENEVPSFARAGALSSTCSFTTGPRAGQVLSYRGQVQPIPVGNPCTDGEGSFGVAVPDENEVPTSDERALSSTCSFTTGPRAGQVLSYRGQVQPIPVGDPCTDGEGSFGVAVPDDN